MSFDPLRILVPEALAEPVQAALAVSTAAPFDVVVHSHVFEHIYEPDRFMSHLAGFMPEGKSLVFSLPNMQAMMERKYTNCINFEHTVLLTEPYVEHLLAKHGFRLQKKSYFMDDHSIFYAAVRDRSVHATALPAITRSATSPSTISSPGIARSSACIASRKSLRSAWARGP